jgi:hypothetical protein
MSTSHDLNSAFGIMSLQIGALQKNMPLLLEAYQYAIEKGFEAPSMLEPRYIELISKVGDHLNDGLEKIKVLVDDLSTK